VPGVSARNDATLHDGASRFATIAGHSTGRVDATPRNPTHDKRTVVTSAAARALSEVMIPRARALDVGTIGANRLGPAPRSIPWLLRIAVMLRGFGTQAWWLSAAMCTHAGAVARGLGAHATIVVFGLVVLSIGFAVYCMTDNVHDLRLLRSGREVDGRRVAEHETGEDGGVFWLTFEYTVGGVVHRSEVRTEGAVEWLRDEPTERMLYDTRDPDHAVPLDNLPGRPRIRDGRFAMQARPLLLFLVPGYFVLAVVGNLAMLTIA
jgi:hypothetical protein